MSSLQKFHRRTNGAVAIVSPFTTIGSGNNTVGYWLGDITTNKLIVAPKSVETQQMWGSPAVARNTISTTDGLANTNTLASYGSNVTYGHPAASACKNLTTGGYNTWYLPAKNELNTLYSNKSATPFASANGFTTIDYWSSTEGTSKYAWQQNFSNGSQSGSGNYNDGKLYNYYVRAVRRTAV